MADDPPTTAAELPDDLAEPGPSVVAPVVAVVGRPNVGKSTLVNRILGRRAAVVEDVPGVTRDRVAYDATWNGRRFTVVDTGGWEPSARGLAAAVAEQAQIAVELADAVLFVIDATVGATDADEAVARVLQRSGRPVVLAVNKVDDARLESDAAELWSLGLGEPYAVSALHGRGSGDLLDAVLAALPKPAPPVLEGEEGGPRRVALLGRPNVGKSSLLNKLGGRAALGGRRRRRNDSRPGRFAACRSAVRRGVSSTRQGCAGEVREAAGRRVLLLAAHRDGAAFGRGRAGAAGRRRAAVRAGPAHPVDGGRGRPGDRDRVQQVGSGRRGPPLRPRTRDRSRPQPYPMGAAGECLGPHRPFGGQARTRDPHRARRLGDPGLDGTAQQLARRGRRARPRRRRVAGRSRRCCSRRRPTSARRGSSSSARGSWKPVTADSWSGRLREDFGFVGTPIEVSVRVKGKDKKASYRPLTYTNVLRLATPRCRAPESLRRTRRRRPVAATGNDRAQRHRLHAELERGVDRAYRDRAREGVRPRTRCSCRHDAPPSTTGWPSASSSCSDSGSFVVRQVPRDLQQDGDGGRCRRRAGDGPAGTEHVQLAGRVRLPPHRTGSGLRGREKPQRNLTLGETVGRQSIRSSSMSIRASSSRQTQDALTAAVSGRSDRKCGRRRPEKIIRPG